MRPPACSKRSWPNPALVRVRLRRALDPRGRRDAGLVVEAGGKPLASELLYLGNVARRFQIKRWLTASVVVVFAAALGFLFGGRSAPSQEEVRADVEPGEEPSERASDAPLSEPVDAGAHEIDPGPLDVGTTPEKALKAGLHPVLGTTHNVLLLGVDRNPGVRRGGLTDTLIIAALDEARGRLGLVSIPRDLYVTVENHGQTRVNAVYAYAKKDKIAPTAAFDRVLRDTLGVPIEHTVVVDLGLLERVVDELGGVEVDVPCPIKDRFVDPRVEGGRRLLDVAAGKQHLDGVTTAMYVRSRHGRSDWNRARRQQAVLMGLRNKITEPELILHVPELIAEWNDAVSTDLSSLQLLNLARKVVGLEVENLHGVVLGHKETLPTRTEQQWSVLMPDSKAIARRLSDVYAAGPPGQSQEVCPDADVALRRRAKPKPDAANNESPKTL